jgi:DNA-binding NtrC family response regulator
MRALFAKLERAAPTDETILLLGESGTGKEVLARAIHESSRRANGPFVVLDCAAIAPNLVEDELFGHVAGAFTGANSAKTGLFELSNGGTLFIDEIGDFALASQAKLLRVLENHTVTPIGSNDDRKVDVRVVAATSRDLERMVEDGDFREDLYYRLNVISLRLPPLRERREDIRPLVDHFLKSLCEAAQRQLLSVDAELARFLDTYEWPGNVRQLRNCLESMVVLASNDSLSLADLPATIDSMAESGTDVDIPSGTTLEALERAAVEQALADCHGNRTRAARALGISVRTLQRKLKAWGLAESSLEE